MILQGFKLALDVLFLHFFRLNLGLSPGPEEGYSEIHRADYYD